MTDDEYTAFYSKVVKEYAAVNVDAGNWNEADALRLSRDAFGQFLPQGRETPRVLLLIAENSSGHNIGYVWIGLDRSADTNSGAWIYDIEIVESQRGKGYGRALLHAAEVETVKQGVRKLGLNVFGKNKVARTLYDSAGYEIVQLQMSKKI